MEFNGIKARWLRRIGMFACVALTALAGCGGGEQVEKFHPSRIVSFGDEASLIVPGAGSTGGKKYTINAVDASASAPANTILCTGTALWNESVASAFGLSFTACPRPGTAANGLIYATPKAKAADVKTQIDNFITTEQPFSHADVVTLMVGLYDILEQSTLYPATPEAIITATLRQRAKALAEQANRIAVMGAPVIVMRLPGVGYTPYAISQGADKAALLNRLTNAFNTELQLNLINDGHLIGIVFGDTEIQFTLNNVSALGLVNATAPACTAAATATDKLDDSVLLGCTTGTLATDAAQALATYLWAGNLMLGPYGQSRLGSLAASRAVGNPF